MRHQLFLDRPTSPPSNSTLQRPSKSFSSIRSIIQHYMHLPSSCCLFLLHIVANFICISLVSRQLVLLSALTKCIHSFCGRNGVPGSSSEKIHLDCYQSIFIPLFTGQNFRCHIKEWTSDTTTPF